MKSVVQNVSETETEDNNVVVLFKSLNNLFVTFKISYFANILDTVIENSENVYANLQEATNETFAGDVNEEVDIANWEYHIENGVSKKGELFTVNLYENNLDNFIYALQVRQYKYLSKPIIDKYVSEINYFAHKTEQPNSFYINGCFFTSSISTWNDSENDPWDFTTPVSANLDLISVVETASEYDSVAKIRRNDSADNPEASETYYFDDLAMAINFADKYSFVGTQTVADEKKYDEILIIKQGEITLNNNAVLKADCTLQIPYAEDKYGYENIPGIFGANWQDYINYDPYEEGSFSKVIVSNGVTLDIQGTITVGAKTGTAGSNKNNLLNQVYVDENGGFGELVVNGTVNVKKNGHLYSYGYITGTGNINAEAGSLVTDMLVINNWPGGTLAFNKLNQVCPFNEYSFANIRCNMNIYYGAEYKAFTSVYSPFLGKGFEQYINIVGDENDDSALFSLRNTSVLGDKSYIRKGYENGYTKIDIYGDVKDNAMTIIIKESEIETTIRFTSNFPIYKMVVTVNNGTYTVTENKFMFMPGSNLIVKEEAKLIIEKYGGLAIMESIDLDGQPKYNGYDVPATADIYGSLEIAGEVVGKINIYDFNKLTYSDNLKTSTNISYVSGLLTDSNPHNLVSSTLSLYDSSNAKTFYFVHFNSRGGSKVNSMLVESQSFIEPFENPTCGELQFLGWYTTPECADGTEFIFSNGQNPTEVNDGIILYAKWPDTFDNVIDFIKSDINNENVEVQNDPIIPMKLSLLDGYQVIMSTNSNTNTTSTITFTFNKSGTYAFNYICSTGIWSGLEIFHNGIYLDKFNQTSKGTYALYVYAGDSIELSFKIGDTFDNDIVYLNNFVFSESNTSYQVTYVTEGTAIAPQMLSVIVASPVTIKVGKNFVGWYDNPDFNGEAISFPYSLTGDITLYAKFGSWESATEIPVGETINVIPTFIGQRFYYTFTPTEATNYLVYTTSDDRLYLNIYEDTSAPYIYSFSDKWGTSSVSNKGFCLDDEIDNNIKFEVGKTYYFEVMGLGSTFVKPFSITVVEKQKYNINFITNGGDPVEESKTLSAYTYSQYNFSGFSASKTNFLGWYYDSDLTKPVTYPFVLTKDITVYAKWAQNETTYTFETNGGNTIDPIATYGELKEVTEPVWQGDGVKYFAGWYDNPDFTGEPIVFPYINKTTNNAITLYAKWTDLNPIVKFIMDSMGESYNFISKLENNNDYPFELVEIDGKPWLQSTNQSVNSSTSQIKLTFNNQGVFSFDFTCSTDELFDKMYVDVNGNTVYSTGGENFGTRQISVNAGDILIIRFSKDSSGSVGDDCIKINNFKFLPVN